MVRIQFGQQINDKARNGATIGRVMIFTKLAKKFYSLSPSTVLTLILGPCFIAYGIGILLGYRSSLIHILGLPAYVYAAMFIIAGALKLCGILFHWGRASHTIGVTVASFWAMAIIVLVPSAAGFAGALPWIAIALIALVAAIWPTPGLRSTAILVKPAKAEIDEITDPTLRAIDYLTKAEERTNGNGHTD